MSVLAVGWKPQTDHPQSTSRRDHRRRSRRCAHAEGVKSSARRTELACAVVNHRRTLRAREPARRRWRGAAALEARRCPPRAAYIAAAHGNVMNAGRDEPARGSEAAVGLTKLRRWNRCGDRRSVSLQARLAMSVEPIYRSAYIPVYLIARAMQTCSTALVAGHRGAFVAPPAAAARAGLEPRYRAVTGAAGGSPRRSRAGRAAADDPADRSGGRQGRRHHGRRCRCSQIGDRCPVPQ